MRHHAGQHKVYFVADALGRQGVPVSVLVPDEPENREFLADKPHIGARFYEARGAFADAWLKTRAYRDGNWSATWIVGVGLRSMILPTVRRAPIVKDFDEFPSLIGSLGPLRRAYLRWIERCMIRQGDGFTCASAYIEQHVRSRRPEIGARVVRLPVAISADEHQADPKIVQRVIQSASGRPILLYVGSVNRFYEDQIDEIIALALTLRRRGSPSRVIIAGGGPDLEYFKTKALRAGVNDALQFVGHLRREGELPSYLEAASALLFPFPGNAFNLSRCPTKAYHYAAANRPVVTNPVGEVASLLGDSALYYPERNTEAFADRCEEALRIGRSFESRIPLRSLTWEARARQFHDWLESNGWAPRSPAQVRAA
jgi:glycosyltransferase involved in cell wall biosynthesis